MRKGEARHGARTYGDGRAAPGACSRYASAVTRRFRFSCFVVAALALSCGHPSAAPPLVPAAAVPPAPCILVPDSTPVPDTLRVAVPDVGRFVQRQVDGTLASLDCMGRPEPLLAVSMKADSSSGVVTFAPLDAVRPTVTVRSSAGGDARDLLDHGIDILVSGDPEVLSYAAGRRDLTTVVLPWDRVYVLLSALTLTISDTARTSLARDVVRSDARPAHGSYWWTAGPACPVSDTAAAVPMGTGSSPSSVIYYPQDDAASRSLAERLVALGLLGPVGRASGVAAADFDSRFAAGGGAWLVPLPREALAPCHAVADLAARAPWLSTDPGRHITALVETRRRAIVRRGGSAFTVDWDGTLRLR